MTFDDQIRAALESTAGSLREHLEAQLRAFSQQASRAAAEERQQAVQAATEAATAEVRSQAQTLVGDIRSQAEAQVSHIRAAAQKHAEEVKRAAEAQIAELRKALDELRAHAQQQLDAAWAVAQGEVESAQAEVDRARAETNQIRTEAEASRADATAARAEADTARAEAQAARAEAQAAHGDVEKARATLEEELGDVARRRADIESLRAQIERDNAGARQSELSRAVRLVDAIRTLDEARGVSDVLDRLIQCAEPEVDRAAMLVVKGERLMGWRLAGFAEDAPPARAIDLDVEQAGLAGVVLQSGVPASRTADGSDGAALPAFAGDAAARDAMALPILVGGEVVAVLYADALRADSSTGSVRWPTTLEVITRHGSRVLEAITVLQAAGLSLPEPMARGSHIAVSAAVEHA